MVQVRNKLLDKMIKRFVVNTNKYTMYHPTISAIRTTVQTQIKNGVMLSITDRLSREYND